MSEQRKTLASLGLGMASEEVSEGVYGEETGEVTWVVTNGQTGEQHQETSSAQVSPEEFLRGLPRTALAPVTSCPSCGSGDLGYFIGGEWRCMACRATS